MGQGIEQLEVVHEPVGSARHACALGSQRAPHHPANFVGVKFHDAAAVESGQDALVGDKVNFTPLSRRSSCAGRLAQGCIKVAHEDGLASDSLKAKDRTSSLGISSDGTEGPIGRLQIRHRCTIHLLGQGADGKKVFRQDQVHRPSQLCHQVV